LGTALDAGPSTALIKALAALSWTGVDRLLPVGEVGPPLTRETSAAYIGTSFGPVYREAGAIDTTMKVAGQFRDLGDRPLVVLTGAKPLGADQLKAAHLTVEQGQKLAAVWKALHDDEASWSHHSRHQIVPDATHYIQFDRPDVVIAAVREVVADL